MLNCVLVTIFPWYLAHGRMGQTEFHPLGVSEPGKQRAEGSRQRRHEEIGLSCLSDRLEEKKEKCKVIPRYLCCYSDPYNYSI